MTNQKIRTIYSITLVFLDAFLIAVAFVIAYKLRVTIEWPDPLNDVLSLSRYLSLLVILLFTIIFGLFAYRQYYIPRAASRVDQIFYIFVAVTLGTLTAVAIATFLFKSDNAILDYPRAMIVYAWLLTIIFLVIGRILHQMIRSWLRERGWGKDRVLLIGSGDMAQAILQQIISSPFLGYELIGVVDDNLEQTSVQEIPILGAIEDLPHLIEHHDIDEVIIAMPEKGHRETVRIISYCERGRVSIKIFPDVFQFVTSQASIDHLGGLPLLSVRDNALRGYMLLFKRAIDIIGALIGLILFSPFMFMVAIAIKLESPGPVFFIQDRMGLDGKPFKMLKFRSMRRDAEESGPGWTTEDDPRQTRLGAFLRRFEVDEFPNFINVLLGEMSLVGPRPEQAHYVNQFQQIVPRYMDRHHEKGGMTGWAQVNGLRGDTSIAERTKYDLWYSENWSILLDIKIVLRTVWQIVERKNNHRENN